MATVIDYTSRDFASIRADLVARTQDALPEWNSSSTSDLLMVILEQFAYIGDVQHFYIDRAAAESFLSTAALRSSVLNIAEMLDYTPIAQQAATVTLTFTTNANVGTVTIPAGTQVATAPLNGNQPVYFETDAALVIDTASAQSGTIPATEGRTVTAEAVGSSTGAGNQVFPLAYPRAVHGSWRVFVADGPPDLNGNATVTEWTYVRRLPLASGVEPVFTVWQNERGASFVAFGDGSTGKIPTIGAAVYVTYRYGMGSTGNVGLAAVRDLVNTITNVTGVTNTTTGSGGSDPETIEQMRRSIPRSVRAIERAVTLDDFESLALQVPGIAKASAVASNSANVDLWVKPNGGAALTADQAQDVSDYFATRTLIGTELLVHEALTKAINVTVELEVNPKYSRTAVQAAVGLAIKAALAFDNQEIGGRVTKAALFAAMLDVPGVDYVDIIVMSTGGSGTADITVLDSEYPIAGTITVNATGGIG